MCIRDSPWYLLVAGSLVEKGLKSPVVPAFNVPELSISFKTELAETLKENVIEVIITKIAIFINFISNLPIRNYDSSWV